jgi:hypothetical protein
VNRSRALKLGSTFIGAMTVYGLVVALLWIFNTKVMFISDFAGYTGQTWFDYHAAAPRFAQIYMINKKLIGFPIISMCVLSWFVNQYGLRKGEKWAWFALLIAGILTWGSLIGYKIAIGYFNPDPSSLTFIVGALLCLAGLAISARAILGKEPTG